MIVRERIFSRSPVETKNLAEKLLKKLIIRSKGPIILALSGELGSGKTTFIQGLAKALGLSKKVQSPTFVLMKWYKLPKPRYSFNHLIHIDAYRIERTSEARHLGLEEIFKDRDAIIVIEWAEQIRRFIPKVAVWINFKHKAKNQRVITMTKWL